MSDNPDFWAPNAATGPDWAENQDLEANWGGVIRYAGDKPPKQSSTSPSSSGGRRVGSRIGQRRDIKGLPEVIANLRKLAARKIANVRPAMVEIVGLIVHDSMANTPIYTGNLRASHRTKVLGQGLKTLGVIFLTAAYALFVHEASPATKFRSKWPKGRKFLERAIVDNVTKAKDIIRKWMRR